ncbi:MAG: Ig-like domain-containing protein [Clostridiaceae bacterium]
MKKLTSCFIAFIMLSLSFIAVPVSAGTVNATPPKYVALGDSISFGMSAANNIGYTAMFSNHLKSLEQYSSLVFVNKSQPGYTTSDLLNQLTIPSVQADLLNADIVTISIGGNNLLSPFIRAIAVGLNVPANINDITAAITKNPNNAALLLASLQDPTDPLTVQLNAWLQDGVAKFTGDFPKIIAAIRTLAPHSKIYVNTLYNPLPASDPLYNQYNTLISAINSGIKAGSGTLGYNVVDAAAVFSNYTGLVPAVNFSLTKAIAAAGIYVQNPTLPAGQAALLSIPTFLDPHPNDIGHQLIYKALVPVTSISLDKTSQDLILGKTLKVTCSVLPIEATYPDVVWSSSNEAVASVDGQGLITAKAPGTAKITVRTKDGNKTSSLDIKVIVPVNSITLDKTSLTLYINGTYTLKATISPTNASGKTLIWKSSNEAVAKVDSNGVVTAIANGTADITVSILNSNVTAKSTVTVINQPALPKTGSIFDLFFMVTLGCTLMGVGFVIIKRTSIKKN